MTDERCPIISADFLGEIRTSSTAKFIAEISADKICRGTHKSRPIFCCPIKSADFIDRLSSALKSHFYAMFLTSDACGALFQCSKCSTHLR